MPRVTVICYGLKKNTKEINSDPVQRIRGPLFSPEGRIKHAVILLDMGGGGGGGFSNSKSAQNNEK